MRILLVALLLLVPVQDGVEPKLLKTIEEGKGLAAKYRNDAGIGRDPKVVFVEDFEREDLKSRWNDIKKHPGQIRFVKEDGRKAIRVDYNAGKNSGGHLYKMFKEGFEKLYFRFYVKFPKDHGYVHHFVHMTGYNPASPWPQGGAGERPKGDERFSTGIDCFGDWGKTPPPGRWGFYSYWCEMKGSPGKYWGNEPKGGRKIQIERDKWICVELMIKCNRVGRADGEQAFWIDGRCAGRWGGYRWRKDPKLKINAVWLLYYITGEAVKRSKGAPKDEHVFFDDIVVATAYIGPRDRTKR